MNFDAQTMWNKDGATGEFTGIKGGSGTTKSFFAGADDKDGTDAKFYAQADGKIFHDSIGQLLYAINLVADASDNDSVNPLSVSNWTSTVTSPSGPTQTTGGSARKVYRVVRHKFGINRVVVQGRGGVDSPSGGGGTVDCLVTVQYGSQSSGQVQVVNSAGNAFDDFEIELDVSGETVGDLVEFEVFLTARVQGANSSTLREAYLEQEMLAITAT